MAIISENKRLAKNTLLMYFRMILIMGINLYASRIILRELGISDFGIYNIVNGIIVSFSFISTALTSAVQRFLAFALGKEDVKGYQNVFSTSLFLFIFIGIVLCAILLPLGDWLISDKFVIPDERRGAALALFFLMIPNLLVSFIGIPFSSAVIAQEKMSFFAYSGIVEALLKLGAVSMLSIIAYDKLIVYGLLLLISAVIVIGINIYYVTKFLKLKLSCRYNKNTIHEIGAFSGWTLLDSLASIGKIEFVNFILNIFYGVTINAAVGIAKQVNSAVNSFTSNFQTAFKPQITKSYASHDNERLMFLVFNTSKFSGVVFFMIAVPLIMNMDFVLKIWLGEYPDLTAIFASLFLFSAGLEAIGGPFWILGHAIGNIKNFQVITSSIRLIAVPLVYFYTYVGFPANYVFFMVVISDFAVLVYRIYYLRIKVDLSVGLFFKDVLLKLIISVILVGGAIYICIKIFKYDWLCLVSSITVSVLLYAILALFYFLKRDERNSLLLAIRDKFYRA